jgi:curli production protein
MADENGYRLWLDTSSSGRMLTIIPHIAAPAGAALRYEIVSTKQGKSGRSSTKQSGGVAVDGAGSGTFAKLSLGVDPEDRYTIAVRVFDGANVVAEQTLNYPQ